MREVPVRLYIEKLAKRAREAARPLSSIDGEIKTKALMAMADRLLEREEQILEANRQDVETIGTALKGEPNKERVREAVDRVSLTREDLRDIAEGLRGIADLPDPVGEVTHMWTRPNSMQVSKIRVPIGVIAVICDFGPAVAIESLALCFKSGNVCILRPHFDWEQTNSVVGTALREAAEESAIPEGALTIVERPEREAALELLRLSKLIEAVIPRGGPGLRKVVTEQAKMPILCHDGGTSYVYVDGDADLPLAQNIVVNSKAQHTTASNSADTLLVHQGISRALLPGLVRRLLDDYKVEVRGCPKTMALTGTPAFPNYKSIIPAKDDDWGQQFLSSVIALQVVTDLDEALTHIARYGPAHTAAIVTRDYAAAMRFTREVDASAVTVNASTRLNDAEEFGLGVHIGISTMRIHARGPIGLEELTCQKYVVLGTGQLRQPHPIPTTYEDAIMLKKH